MRFVRIGDPEAREKLTARIYFRPVTESGFIDAGNVADYSNSTSRSTVNRHVSARGFRNVNDEQVDRNHESYTFTLDERVPENDKLLKLARQEANQVQGDTEGASTTIEAATRGRWHDVGAFNVFNVSASGEASGDLTEGIDFDVDAPNGRVYFRPEGAVSDGEDVVLIYDRPGMELEKHTTQQNPMFRCAISIDEHNQFSRVFLRRKTFIGVLIVTEFPSQTGPFATYKVKVTPDGPVTVLKRPTFDTLPTRATETGDAGQSSSSSSRSSVSTVESYTSSSSTSNPQSSQSSRSSSSSSSSTAASVTSSSSSSSQHSSSSSSSSSSTAASQTSSSSQSSSSSSSVSGSSLAMTS